MQSVNYLYLVDNLIVIYQRKEQRFLEYTLSNKIIEFGKIIHRPKFTREFQIFLKKNHIIKRFQKNILIIITPPNFNEVDKEIWNRIFEDIPFQEIKYTKETNYYELKKNTLWVNVQNSYAYLTYLFKNQKNSITIQNNYLNLSLFEQLKTFLLLHPQLKKVYLFGASSDIVEKSKKLEKNTNKIILYFENSKFYLINTIERHNLI